MLVTIDEVLAALDRFKEGKETRFNMETLITSYADSWQKAVAQDTSIEAIKEKEKNLDWFGALNAKED